MLDYILPDLHRFTFFQQAEENRVKSLETDLEKCREAGICLENRLQLALSDKAELEKGAVLIQKNLDDCRQINNDLENNLRESTDQIRGLEDTIEKFRQPLLFWEMERAMLISRTQELESKVCKNVF